MRIETPRQFSAEQIHDLFAGRLLDRDVAIRRLGAQHADELLRLQPSGA